MNGPAAFPSAYAMRITAFVVVPRSMKIVSDFIKQHKELEGRVDLYHAVTRG